MFGMIILGITVVIGIYAVSSYNGFIQIKNSTEEAFATIDVYL